MYVGSAYMYIVVVLDGLSIEDAIIRSGQSNEVRVTTFCNLCHSDARKIAGYINIRKCWQVVIANVVNFNVCGI